jgi:hypothetical protein
MKKTSIALVILMGLSASVNANKMTYEDAVQSGQTYRESIERDNIETPTDGLGDKELLGGNASNKMGKWVKLGHSTMLNAGQYASVLAPSASGQSCLKGEKGFIASTKEECTRWNSGGWQCQESVTTLDIGNGFKAECR